MNRDTEPENRFFISAMCVGAVLLLGWLFAPFAYAVLLAALLAVATIRPYRYLRYRCGMRSNTWSALLMCTGLALCVIAPLAYVAAETVSALRAAVPTIKAFIIDIRAGEAFVEHASFFAGIPFADSFRSASEKIVELSFAALEHLSHSSVALTLSTVSALTTTVMTVFILFFFYRDHRAFAHVMSRLLPLPRSTYRFLTMRLMAVTEVLLWSVLGTAAMQGVCFAVLAWFVGLPALYVGICAALSAFVPIVGLLLVWLPTAYWLFADGKDIAAIVVVLWGIVGGGIVIDNIFRPWLIGVIGRGRDVGIALTHTLLTVLATLAGIIRFGIIGLMAGPVIAALTITIIELSIGRIRNGR